MKYRRVGSTDLSLSEIGFGSGGNAGLMVRGSLAEQRHAVARAWELGITYFDTAPDYGDGAAEQNLGRVIKDLAIRPIINSKVEIRAENLGDIAGHVVRSAEASLKRLGVDSLDFLQIHNGPIAGPTALAGSGYATLAVGDFLKPGGALDGLRRLKGAGKARHLCLI